MYRVYILSLNKTYSSIFQQNKFIYPTRLVYILVQYVVVIYPHPRRVDMPQVQLSIFVRTRYYLYIPINTEFRFLPIQTRGCSKPHRPKIFHFILGLDFFNLLTYFNFKRGLFLSVYAFIIVSLFFLYFVSIIHKQHFEI